MSSSFPHDQLRSVLVTEEEAEIQVLLVKGLGSLFNIYIKPLGEIIWQKGYSVLSVPMIPSYTVHLNPDLSS